MITDGRDSAPKSALTFLAEIEPCLHEAGGAVASIIGRYYAMDRDKRWNRTQKAFDCLTKGKGKKAKSAEDAVRKAYRRGETDEFVLPTLINADGLIKNGDAVVFFNFRADRARQITRKFLKQTKTFFVSM